MQEREPGTGAGSEECGTLTRCRYNTALWQRLASGGAGDGVLSGGEMDCVIK